jgi:fermentation-respiration switch protein FrsA (DUF1100 family)
MNPVRTSSTFKEKPTRKPIKIALRILILLLVTYAVWCGIVYVKQDSLIFPRSAVAPVSPQDEQPQIGEQLMSLSRDGTPLRVILWMPGDLSRKSTLAPGQKPIPALIYLHGNAERIEHTRAGALTDPYKNLGFAVALLEYRGYSPLAPGEPSQDDITRDLVTLYDALASDPRIDPSRIVFHGRSLGGGFACDLARYRAPALLILESTFTSIASFSTRVGVPGFLCKHPLRNDQVIPTLSIPVLIMHTTSDALIPISHARTLKDLAKDAQLLEMPGGHSECPNDFDAYTAAITGFLKKHGYVGR